MNFLKTITTAIIAFTISIGGVGANLISDAYTGPMDGVGAIDPVTHKLLHAVLGGATGGILNGTEGAISGATAAVIAETLADLTRPSMIEAFENIKAEHPGAKD